jgi:hypothetical protein
MRQGSLPQFLSAESATTVMQRRAVVRNGATWRGIRHSAEMSGLLPRFVAYLHTPQICGVSHGVKVGLRRISSWGDYGKEAGRQRERG